MANTTAKKISSKGMLSTKALYGVRVVGGRSGDKRIGKVRRFVFHPSSKRCVGFLVKRPDLALMFHRRDLFVPIDGFEIVDGRVAIPHGESDMEGKGAIKRMELDWESCTMWEGMPIISEDGEQLGTVGDIEFAPRTGKVASITANRGSTAKALLGQAVIPSELILGFRLGIGTEMVAESDDNEGASSDAEPMVGAILVSNEVVVRGTEGGIAEKAGQQTAVAKHKAKQVVAKAKPKIDEAAKQVVAKTKPKIDDATKQAGEAIGKGAYATGKHLTAAKGMFAEFKKEYDKAKGDE